MQGASWRDATAMKGAIGRLAEENDGGEKMDIGGWMTVRPFGKDELGNIPGSESFTVWVRLPGRYQAVARNR